jgi:hypothetical protein
MTLGQDALQFIFVVSLLDNVMMTAAITFAASRDDIAGDGDAAVSLAGQMIGRAIAGMMLLATLVAATVDHLFAAPITSAALTLKRAIAQVLNPRHWWTASHLVPALLLNRDCDCLKFVRNVVERHQSPPMLAHGFLNAASVGLYVIIATVRVGFSHYRLGLADRAKGVLELVQQLLL